MVQRKAVKKQTEKTSDEKITTLEVKNLQMRYGTKDILSDVTFSARQGEVLVLLGPNGAGKTTTIEILEGFRSSSAGTVRVLGVDPQEGDEMWRAQLGVVLQSWRDHSRWGVRTLLNHLSKYYIPYATPERPPFNVDDLIKMVGLSDQASQKVSSLSGGQRRRLDVAIGIVGRPRVLFLDEPTVGFDPEARREFHEVLHRLSDLDDTTILLTTHDLDEAEKLADRIIILAGGRIVASGSADQLARQVSNTAQVRWSRAGQPYVHSTEHSTQYVRELFEQYGDKITDLEVHRASLEDTYIAMVHSHEVGKDITANGFKG